VPLMTPPEGALRILRTLREAGHQALLAGGCVRDGLMGLPAKDWDIVTGAGPGEVMALFERTVPVGAQFGVVRVLMPDGEYEVARFRRDDAYLDGRRPVAVHPASAEEDARRRDFTLNGMFYDPAEDALLDLVEGRRDIEARAIRAIGDPEARFEDDHLRMLRAVRFAARFGFAIEPATFAAMRKLAPRIRRTSTERVRDELTGMLTGDRAEGALQLLMDAGLLGEVLPECAAMEGVDQPPEFHPEGDVWTHVKRMFAAAGALSPALAWAVLLHDAGKPATRTVTDRIRFNGHAAAGARMAEEVARRLRFSGEEALRVRDLVAHHMRFMNVRQMRESRLKRLLREPFFPELLELHRLDCAASHGDLSTYAFCREKLAEASAGELRPPRLLDGHALMAMGFPQGPILAEILAALEDEQLEGRVGTGDEARAFAENRFGWHRGGGVDAGGAPL